MTQIKQVEEYIKEMGSVFTYQLERWAQERFHGDKCSSGSATRYARLLRAKGKVEHPKDKNGVRNRHLYKWKKEPVCEANGQAKLF